MEPQPGTPIPPASGDTPGPLAPEAPKRPWTILGRLSQAVREQNWFAVVLEVLIVIVGVVIGFQVTAWGQSRADLDKEQTYLRQLASDLDETEALIEMTDSHLAPSERAAERLFEDFRTEAPLPADTVLALVSVATLLQEARPLLGTAETLVNTGDLALIRDDSLREAIPAYLEEQRRRLAWQDQIIWDLTVNAFVEINRHIDMAEADAALFARGGTPPVPRPGVYGSTSADGRFVPDSVTTSLPPFPFDVDRFRRDRDAYHVVWMLGVAKRQAKAARAEMATLARTLSRRVHAELDP